jgi:nitroreductase / dihydropteridine reductase
MTNIIENLKWRYATKVFDTTKAVSAEDLNFVLDAGNLAASSYGLQPFTFVVVDDAAKKQALIEHAYGQTQIAANGALIVIAARTDVDTAYISEFTARIESTRGLPGGSVDGYKDMMVGSLTNQTPEARLVWAQKQSYIALGTMMSAASERGIDNAALEGFNPDKFNEVLGLAEHNLHATVLLVLGYRSTEDATSQYAKVRKDIKDIVVHM